MKLNNLMDITRHNWQKKEKSNANILGYQPKYEIPKTLFKIIKSYDSNGGILKDDLYRIIYKDYNKESKDYKRAFENSLNLLDQINLIDTYIYNDHFLYKVVKNDLPLRYNLKFFHLIKNLKALPKSPYILYEQLIRKNIYVITDTKNLYEFSVSIENTKNYKDYNINTQQIPYWVNLFDNLGAITRVNNQVYLIPNYSNCFEILKYCIKLMDKSELNIKLDDIITYFEKDFYPILIEDKRNKKQVHPWFNQFIDTLMMQNMIEVLLIDDSIAYEINNARISNIKLCIEME